MDLTLVVLAAGLGSRFGGDKQIVDVGPSGEALLDYAIADGQAAGFGRVVLVVRAEIEDALMSHVGRFHPDLHAVAVRQDTFGPPRGKPWGTAHAVLAVRDAVPGRFAVANADDFYGAGSFGALAEFLGAGGPDDEYAIVGFEIGRTLSPTGGVTRGVLRVDDDGFLIGISEERGVHRNDAGDIVSDSDPEGSLDPATPVSMNLWGLTPTIFDLTGTGFDDFRAAHADDPSAEYLLPEAIDDFVSEGRVRVRVLRSDAPWFGLTHPGDLPAVRTEIRRLVDAGVYPPDLSRR